MRNTHYNPKSTLVPVRNLDVFRRAQTYDHIRENPELNTQSGFRIFLQSLEYLAGHWRLRGRPAPIDAP